MASGFTSPSILFLNTWDAPERSFCRTVFEALSDHSTYQRYVEPCCGAFAMPLVAQNGGWTADRMTASDTSLYSSIVGTMLDSGDFEALDVRVDGDPVKIEGDTAVQRAAWLLWTQVRVRTEVRPPHEYWKMLVGDLTDNRQTHLDSIERSLTSMYERLGGLSYSPLDMWSEVEKVLDDPEVVVSINPPTYKSGFERFFDTKGRLTWAEPAYEVFDPDVGNDRLMDMFEGKNALLLGQQQREPGRSAHRRPVFARHLSAGQYVYLNSNRPDEIFEITGGPAIGLNASSKIASLDGRNAIPYDYEVTADSDVRVVTCKASEADYYRGLWMHRLKAEPGSMNLLVLIDGFAAGVIGYNPQAMITPFNDRWDRHIILRFAFGAPHKTMRLTRLATMIALQRRTVEAARTPTNSLYLAASDGLVTVEYTRHPEAKGLRGLMKLADRTPHPDGFRLVYGADWQNRTHDEVLADFVRNEERWQTERATA